MCQDRETKKGTVSPSRAKQVLPYATLQLKVALKNAKRD